jgi:mRNA-degrading endonuclease RelE of RelBE toxin-antitoxin system
MEFRIADTFLASLARLTGEEQKQVKITVFDLQANPSNPGHQFHKLDRSRDRNFWSVRVGSDIRLIVHKTSGSLLVCYVDHHDKAYAWAERRKLEVHPTTGAAQMVEMRETVKEIVVPRHVEALSAVPAPRKLFESLDEASLLRMGVPSEWIADVREANEEGFFNIASHLPVEAAEVLLEVATGGSVPLISLQVATADISLESALDHPDALRRFRRVENSSELERALDAPWDRWTVFLHPDQREIVERTENGPARVSGSAGTGKTIVALHRAVFLARANTEARVLLTTFSDPLAAALGTRLRRLVGNEPRLADRIDVAALDAVAERLYRTIIGKAPILVPRGQLRDALAAVQESVTELRVQRGFLLAEWDQVVDAWGLTTWEAYRDVARLGRRTRLREEKRRQLWRVFSIVLDGMKERQQITRAMMFTELAGRLAQRANPPYDFAVVDEAQDVSIAQLRFLAALNPRRSDSLFFAGDLGQRIFQQPFSWKAIGVDIRGRSKTLHVNYRTSHQIRSEADKLLGPEVSDADGNSESRKSTISLFNGPLPLLLECKSEQEECSRVSSWIAERIAEGCAAHEFGIFVRSDAQIARAARAAATAKLPYRVLDLHLQVPSGFASLGTMHLAKGLEFKAVVVMACDESVLPLQERIEEVGEDGDLQEAYESERQLLYVACTRARDMLLVSGVMPVSEFLEDLAQSKPTQS